MSTLLTPEERVLSTLNADGTRRWLDPKHVTGFFRNRRLVLAWFLIAIFNVIPHLHLNGKQMFFANIAGGEFTLFGVTFLRTDTLLLALAAVSTAVAVFLVTALFGRVWCGWMCPQTVYLEFLFRPIGNFFNGKGTKGVKGTVSKLPKPLRVTLRWGIVALVCFHLSNTFLSYFVGSRTVYEWSMQSPLEHPAGFAFVLFITAAMIYNFGFFREQLCFIACPYGRFQSVLLDRQSLIVGYDYNRGEPRGIPCKKRKAKTTPDISLEVITDTNAAPTNTTSTVADHDSNHDQLGDCVDCTRCVQVCPTGIDIREGLQLECIHCARCIDACDEVMTKLGRDTGLIRYSSQQVLAGERSKFLRPRVIIYPLIFTLVFGALITLGANQAAADVRVIRGKGAPFYTLPTGEISNQLRVRLTNRTSEPRSYTITPAIDGFRLMIEGDATNIEPGETRSVTLLIIAQPEAMVGKAGVARVPIEIADDDGFTTTQESKFLGPMRVMIPAETQTETPSAAPAETTP
ncbi:MAG: 4Fe-4S dicluster domain-containing protein [Planctomycetota bacterium]